MKLTPFLALRRIINSGYHPFRVIPKPAVWPKRERLKRLTAWQFGQQMLTVRAGYQKLHKVFIYMDMQRRDAPRLERHYAEERVKAALAEHNAVDFQLFRQMLARAHILLDERTLSQLAIYEPRTFKSLVDLVQKMALVDGEQTAQSAAELAHVHCDAALFGQPFPEAREYPLGSADNHFNVPRQLKLEEY